MSKTRFHILFFTRLVLYLVAFSLPIFHPAVVISYDATSWWLWFVFIPAQMIVAYFLVPPKLDLRVWLGTTASLIVLSLIVATGFGPESLLFIAAQLIAFATTALVFHGRGVGRPLAVAEMLFLGFFYVRVISFSRASEDFADASSTVTQLVLALSLGAVFLHSLLLYLSTYREGLKRRSLKEAGIFLTIAAALGLIVAFVMPPDFVNHAVVLNDLKNPPDPETVPLDDYGNGLDDGNLRSDRLSERDGNNGGNGDQQGDQGESGGEDPAQGGEPSTARLEGIPSEQWESRSRSRSQGQGSGEAQGEGEGEGEGEGKQYAVMVVAGKHDPIYAAEAYYADFDQEAGFLLDRTEPLNDLTHLRLLETWENPEPSYDRGRVPTEVFTLSTIPERALAYEPRSIEPTILNTVFHPFSFAYTSVSGISRTGPREWRAMRNLTSAEMEALSPFLEISIPEDARESVLAYHRNLIGERTATYAQLDAILEGFSSFQYNVGFTDDVSVDHIVDFLFNTKDGDCTEFSNATALLARLSGIPARVVTGYLASSNLQTQSHTRGLAMLQQSVEPLQQYPLDELYLVTSAHRHSWIQVYMPDYGWVDIETTATAIPPAGNMNPNSMNVVIPIITPQEVDERNFQFPWLLVLQTLLVLVVSGIAGLYAFRVGRRAYLTIVSRGTTTKSLRALDTLLLSKLATEGYPIKPRAETPAEYAEQRPELSNYSALYTKLRYKERFAEGERQKNWEELRAETQDVAKNAKRRGFGGFIRRVFSLRELQY